MKTFTRTALFDRVVCGVDRSDAGIAAARAAGRILSPDGSLVLLAVSDPSIAVQASWRMPQLLGELEAEAQSALQRALAEVEPQRLLDAKLVTGDPLHVLLGEIERRDATLVVVGSHGLSRVTGIALGAVSTHLLHDAPCAVLIARGRIDAAGWPRRIVVGVDGSEGSAAALDAARELAERVGAPLRVIAALEDVHLDLEAVRRLAPECEEHEARPLDTLSVASERSDLVVVGSRGLRGVGALGSLSERLAHEARCSVLVVRGPVDEDG